MSDGTLGAGEKHEGRRETKRRRVKRRKRPNTAVSSKNSSDAPIKKGFRAGVKLPAVPGQRFAAIDLGTNNCRLLIAAPRGRRFRIVDAFSRIVRLGEGLSHSGVLSEAAMSRAIEAIKVCAEKIELRGVTRGRYIATQACRAADNGVDFLERVKKETGLNLEVITTEEEARLAVNGCADLYDPRCDAAVVFDIGGGSTEISWVRPKADKEGVRRLKGPIVPQALEIVDWFSLPIGVVNLSEKWGGRSMDGERYDKIVNSVRREIAAHGDPLGVKKIFMAGRAHALGTSGTVTSIAGVHLGLVKYQRDRVDGLWLQSSEVRDVSEKLCAMSYEELSDQPCIGKDRADLVVLGCAILEALLAEWPTTRIRVGDRGLREGILTGLIAKSRRRRRTRRKPNSRREVKKGEASAVSDAAPAE